MVIQHVYFEGLKLLSLNGLSQLKIKDLTTVNLILGRNGSGKTTILSRIIPHVPNKNDYNQDALYELCWKDGADTYICRCVFKQGHAEHYFILNDENLNDGRTARVQQKLINEYTGITSDVYDLLIGEVKFTDLSPAKRKEWMMLLSSSDLSYVEQMFREARSRINQSKGVLTHLNKKLSQEMDKILEQSSIDQKVEEVKLLQRSITDIQKKYDSSVPSDVNNVWSSIEEQFDGLNMAIDNAMSVNLDPPNGIFIKNIEALEDPINQLNMDISNLKGKRESLDDEYNRLSHIIENVKKSGHGSVEELSKERDKLLKRYKTMYKTVSFLKPWFLEDMDLKAPTSDFQTTVQQLTPLLQEIHVTDVLTDWGSEYRRYRGLASETNDKITVTQNQLGRVVGKLEHMKNCEKTVCPKCTHSFHVDITEQQEQQIHVIHEKLNAQLESLLLEHKSYKEREELAYSQLKVMENIKLIYVSSKDHHRFWSVIMEDNLYLLKPNEVYGYMTSYSNFEGLWGEVCNIYFNLTELEGILAAIGKAGNNSVDIVSRIEAISEEDAGYAKEANIKTARLKELVDYRERLRLFMSYFSEAIKLEKKLLDDVEVLAKAKVNAIYESVVNEKLVILSHVQRTINEQEVVAKIIDDIKTSIEEEKKRHEGFILLSKVLGPKEGIIADQITSYIEELCLQMNSIIDSSWSYPMEICSCTDEQGELDYKFPLDVMNGSLTPADIKYGSAGQREIINIAFKIVAQVSLNKQSLPLLLDEPGQNFDPTHVNLFMRYLNNLMGVNGFSQLFMISHTFSGYGMFTNASTIKLDQLE